MKYFYGKKIDPEEEAKKIEKILNIFKSEPVSENLKIKIYNKLLEAQKEGKVFIPFRVILRKDPQGVHPDYIEVLLDTKV